MDPRRIRLVAHNIRSLWNVGSLFRSSDAFSVERLYLTGYTGAPPRKEISKTALGAEETVPWEQAADPLEVLRALKRDGWQLLALELGPAAVPLPSFPAGPRVCVVVGHELDGVPPEQRALCDATVMIPMHGSKESLNVAVAAGIALYALRCA